MNIDDLIVMYEDNHIIVVMKPHNIPSCEDETGDVNMLSLIKEYVKRKENKAGEAYIGLIHRLDRPTGGVMVFAKTSKAAARLSAQMQEGLFEKRYLAVLTAIPKTANAELTNYLKKNAVNNMVYVCGATVDGAKLAKLEYNVVAENEGLALADIRLYTGRSHQIRVQMSSIGCPVYGDMRYGGADAKKGGLALFAYYLSFLHPVTKERMVFKIQPDESTMPWSKFDTSRLFEVGAQYKK